MSFHGRSPFMPIEMRQASYWRRPSDEPLSSKIGLPPIDIGR
jgi:hypothetical protein